MEYVWSFCDEHIYIYIYIKKDSEKKGVKEIKIFLKKKKKKDASIINNLKKTTWVQKKFST